MDARNINPKQYEDGSYYKAAQRAPAVLLPYQRKWIEDKSPVKIIEKSRRIGLSWCEAADNVLTAASNNGMDIFYVSYNKDMTVTYINDCAQWAKHFNLAASEIEISEQVFRENDEDKSTLVYSIKFASGFRIEALSSMPRNLRSKQGGVVVDEAAFHTDLEELLTAAFALLIWGGFVHILSTHKGVDNPFNILIGEVRAGEKDYSLHKTTFNDAIADGLYRRVCLRARKDWSLEGQIAWEKQIRSIYAPKDAEELDCIPSQSSGAYFSRSLVESRMSDEYVVLRLECEDGFELKPEHERIAFINDWLEDNIKPILERIPANHRFYYGQDFARSRHVSAFWSLVEETSARRYMPIVKPVC